MQGVRRKSVPQAELDWLKRHIYCDSIRQLFLQYSEKFGSPYSDINTFRAMMARHHLYPISKWTDTENVNEMLSLMMKGSTKWVYRSKDYREGIRGEPHWLWRWHEESLKTPTGVMFKQFHLSVREKQYGEDIPSDDTL